MAAARIKYGTLTASTVKTETLDARYSKVEVVNRDASADIFFTVDGSTPAADTDNINFCPAGKSVLVATMSSADPTVVKLFSAGTPKYVVSGSEQTQPMRA